MSALLSPVVELYRNALQPVEPLSTLTGVPLSMLDIGAAFRLCLVLRQIREQLRAKHAQAMQPGLPKLEPRSFVREAATTLIVVYGGEALTGPWLGQSPSFMLSGVVPLLYIFMQALVERLPNVPDMNFNTEFPLSFMDGLTRAYLLCNLVPPAVLTHASPAISTSPWTLLVSALITPNAGFFILNLFSFLQPHALTVSTPPELLPYGWTTTDIWCAPLITGLYSLLTHAQPFWAELHYVMVGWLGGASIAEDGTTKVAAVDPETARALCAVVLATLFGRRTWKNFGASQVAAKKVENGEAKVKAQ